MGRPSKTVKSDEKSPETENLCKAPMQLDPSHFSDPRMHQIALDIQQGKVPDDVLQKLHAFLLEGSKGANALVPSESSFDSSKVKPRK